MSNDAVREVITRAFEPYCRAYCQDPARLVVNVVDEFVNAHLFLSAADHAVIEQGELSGHLSDCFDMLGKKLGEGRERLGIDFVNS